MRYQEHNGCCKEPRDFGPDPCVVNLAQEAAMNTVYRRALWTGCHLQLTLMCIPAGGEIGLEVHPDTDQFIRIEEGMGIALMGKEKDCLTCRHKIYGGYCVFVPAGTWHNVVTTGACPMKIYTIYAPPHHKPGTCQATKREADMQEKRKEG